MSSSAIARIQRILLAALFHNQMYFGQKIVSLEGALNLGVQIWVWDRCPRARRTLYGGKHGGDRKMNSLSNTRASSLCNCPAAVSTAPLDQPKQMPVASFWCCLD
jgi:hypothetical protein